MTLSEFLEQLPLLSGVGNSFKPHKYLALLAVIRLINSGSITSHDVFFNDEFRVAFTDLLKTFGGDIDRDRPHNPFFHLRSHSFWKLVAKPGQETALSAAPSVGSPNHLISLISHAELDDDVFNLLRAPITSHAIEQRLLELVKTGMASRSERSSDVEGELFNESLFAHEMAAQDAIRKHVRLHGLGTVLTNLQLHDVQSNRYFEVDLVVIASFGIYVVELKHWSGKISVQPNSWVQNNSFFKQDPHKANNFKAKLLKGLCERKFPHFNQTYFESVVVLTNPDVTVEGASAPNTSTHNPTFDSLDRFLLYLKQQRQASQAQWTDTQCKSFGDYVLSLQTTHAPRDFVFPGYEIVERLYQHSDRAEVIARRTDLRHRRLSRLRIFYPSTDRSGEERRRARERATATLNAVAKVGEHPNILKVWSIPSDNDFIIEGSDWSETGTLRDVLDRESQLGSDRAQAIALGICRGLFAIHNELVVHRALSPENILMVDGVPKLMNFDLSYQLEDDRLTVIPDATQLKRSPYIAPEIYAPRDIPDGRADLFSVGVILYEMIIGSRPFGCSLDMEQTGGKLSAEKREHLAKHNVQKHLLGLILDLIQQDPKDRPADVLVALRRLEEADEAVVTIRETNPQLSPGDQCGLYAIEELIARGAESQLYRAVGVSGQQIALKLFDHDVPQQRVVNEHRSSGAVLHPTIVRVDSYSQWTDGRYFIAFEWVAKRTLRDDIVEGVRPDLQRFTSAVRQLLGALGALHRNTDREDRPDPILHNDIKPDNILLADHDRPILVDFGASSRPHIGMYQGTEGYVAPDLRSGEDRKYSEDGDLFAIAVTLHEWLFGTPPNVQVSLRPEIPPAVVDWLHKGSAPEAADRFNSVQQMWDDFTEALKIQEPVANELIEEIVTSDEEIIASVAIESPIAAPRSEAILDPNPFVSYLNSLHNTSADTDNALAESQARNPLFGLIQISHPLAVSVEQLLTGTDRQHVIITGHAGDGKSTIALEVIKRLRNIAIENPLNTQLLRRENIQVRDLRISVVKDFSEWSAEERAQLLVEMLSPDSPRFFLVSNTGTLLDAFKVQEREWGGDPVRVESELLAAISALGGDKFSFRNTSFSIFNIAMADNLSIARRIFDRMLHADRWKVCETQECRKCCPIFRNVTLMRTNQAVVRERLFLIYRRTYEYGYRLTLRQLSAHLAYMITSGLSFQDILSMSERAQRPPMAEFMFFNRFFGDNGREIDYPALQLRAVRVAREQRFGVHSSPTWERKLWHTGGKAPFQLRAVDPPDDFAALRSLGTSSDSIDAAAQARDQVRRVLFFLHSFDYTDTGFLKIFLKSAMVLDFAQWQSQENEALPLHETSSLHRRILHVLQEHFTGVRLPEGTPSDRHLFITLSRRSHDVRQSAQIVLARFPDDEFRVRLVASKNVGAGKRRELILEGPSRTNKLILQLSLPFLDYVMMRSQGEIGGTLQSSFLDRLERFKGQLIREVGSRESDDIMLVRLRTNNTFRRHIFSVRGERLEVTDA